MFFNFFRPQYMWLASWETAVRILLKMWIEPLGTVCYARAGGKSLPFGVHMGNKLWTNQIECQILKSKKGQRNRKKKQGGGSTAVWGGQRKHYTCMKWRSRDYAKPRSLDMASRENRARDDFYRLDSVLFPTDGICRRSNPSWTLFGSKDFRKSIKVK